MIERASANDLMQRAADVGPTPPQIAGVLVLDAPPDLDPAGLAHGLGLRLAGIPRLRQALRPAPLGCGRRYWADVPGFDPRHHVRVVRAASPGDEEALLAAALAATTRPLPQRQPPWSVTVVDGLAAGRVAAVVVVDHVLSDGVSGLALLQTMAGPPPTTVPPPRAGPRMAELARDAWQHRARAVHDAPQAWRRAVAAVHELRAAPLPRAPTTSLNRPVGPRRAVAVVRTDLAAVRSAAHAHGGTVNDVLLTAVLAALGHALRAEGDDVSSVCISVPVSRGTGSSGALGNRVSVMPLQLPVPAQDQDLGSVLREVAGVTRPRKASGSDGAVLVVEPAFRLLRSLGVLGWLLDHQHMINTVVSNVAGPRQPLELVGLPVRELIPISSIYGNVPVAFTALSYLDELVVTVMTDPDIIREPGTISAGVRDAFDALGRPFRQGEPG